MLESIISLYKSDSTTYRNYEPCIVILNELICETAQNKKFREDLSNREESWLEIKEVIDLLADITLETVDISQHLRVVKALVFVSRNLSVGNRQFPQSLQIPTRLISLYLRHRTLLGPQKSIGEIYIAICEFSFNCSVDCIDFDRKTINEHVTFLGWSTDILDNDSASMLISNLIANFTHSDTFLTFLFEDKQAHMLVENIVMEELIMKRTELSTILQSKNNDIENLSALAMIQIKIFKKLVSHELFGSYLKNLNSTEGFTKFKTTLDIASLTITSIESWNKFELIGIMSWCLEYFEEFSLRTKALFEDGPFEHFDYQQVYLVLESLLDILTNLTQYEHVQKYILAYNGLQKIIFLFDILEKNCLKLQLKKSSTSNCKIPVKAMDYLGNVITSDTVISARVQNGIIDYSNFPGIKCYLVEILGFMAYGQSTAQDIIRDLNGLELVLSNCIIDDNNPFLKERCILCIKYLLANNQKNQDFVAALEAKKPINDAILEEAGYEVTIDNKGSVKLSSTNQGNKKYDEPLNRVIEEIKE